MVRPRGLTGALCALPSGPPPGFPPDFTSRIPTPGAI